MSRRQHPARRYGDVKLVLSLNGLAIVALGVLPGPLLAACLTAIKVTLAT
jgi:NADH-quinone oxidoreductase subunit N